MDLSIIIVNYNVRDFLENALTSLLKAAEGIAAEIIVVDNASDDGSVEMVREKFPQVRLLASTVNTGFARGNNLALADAAGRYLLLINPDTIVREDTLRTMIRFMDARPDAGLAGCRILNPDGTLQLACRRSFPTPWVAFTKLTGLSSLAPRSRLFGRYNLTYLDPAEDHEVEAISGSFMMMRRETYERVGGLDERFFMYGEDLDWCYRVREAGCQVWYVAGTSIIHFKGESTRRSSADDVRLFYHAMQQFVEKHHSGTLAMEVFLTLGILLRSWVAFLGRAARPIAMALLDAALVVCALIAGELLYFGRLFALRPDVYPLVWGVPAALTVTALWIGGMYTTHRFSPARAAGAVLTAFTLVSAVVFFAKDFAFSRALVLMSGGLSVLLIPGWRLGMALAGRTSRPSLFGRRTLIVGTGDAAIGILRKIRSRVTPGYEVVGFVDLSHRRVGERVEGVDVLGSVENLSGVIDRHRITDVIFAPDALPYSEIMTVIARAGGQSVTFRLVPSSMEAIIGRASVDVLDPLPLVDIAYALSRPANCAAKRTLDLLAAVLLLPTAYPLARLAGVRRTHPLLLLPQVFSGRLSLVGRPLDDSAGARDGDDARRYLGKHGLTGLVQINARDGLTPDEREHYLLYYARNQSLLLDLEIILKSVLFPKK
jgi:hypothetical protein